MATADIITMDGASVGKIELNPTVFDAPLNQTLVTEVVVALQNARRQGNAETKVRSKVSGGGIKPYRQKGTGNARHGSSREPQMRGGGTVFGPHKRSYRQHVPIRLRRQAVCCVLSERLRTGKLRVLQALNFDAPKTKAFASMMAKVVPSERKTLFITPGIDKITLLASRNIPGVSVKTAIDVNAIDLLDAMAVIIVQDALKPLENRLAVQRAEKERAL